MSTDIVHLVRKSGDNDDKQYVQLRVKRSTPQSLDWDFASCDGDAIYTLRLHQRTLKNARAPAFKGDDSTWFDLLRWTLFREDSASIDTTRHFELIAQASPDEHVILIRENLPGRIIQRLGSMTLKYSEDASNDADLFSWSQAAAQQSLAQHGAYLELAASLRRTKDDNDRLRQALQDLTEAKVEHERQLLEKARKLINSKKLKIRDQQRLLAGAKIDTTSVKQDSPIRDAKGHRPLPSRKSKRGAKDIAPDVATEHVAANEANEGSGDEVETDSDEGIKTPDSRHDNTDESDDLALKASSQEPERARQRTEQSENLPRKRQLPFNSKKSAAPIGGAETEDGKDTEDEDEL